MASYFKCPRIRFGIRFGIINLHTFDRYFTLPPPRQEHAATPDTPLVESTCRPDMHAVSQSMGKGSCRIRVWVCLVPAYEISRRRTSKLE
jgi:hypothetical protein